MRLSRLVPLLGAEDSARFDAATVAMPNGCIEFSGYRLPTGHGRFGAQGRVWQAHRIAYRRAFGEFDPELHICHRCDNPPCVNPAHLFTGTNADNMADCKSKGRQSQGEQLRIVRLRQDQCNRKLTPEIVAAIRSEYVARDPQRGMKALARRFGTSRQNVRLVLRGETWGHVDGGASCVSPS
jgi:hypothetical protein